MWRAAHSCSKAESEVALWVCRTFVTRVLQIWATLLAAARKSSVWARRFPGFGQPIGFISTLVQHQKSSMSSSHETPSTVPPARLLGSATFGQ